MPKIIRSSAFPNGVAEYSPIDPEESAILSLPSLVAWMSASSMSYRSVDNIWADVVAKEKFYATPGRRTEGAMASIGFNDRLCARIYGNEKAYLRGNFSVPQSYSVFALFSADNVPDNTQCIVSELTGAQPQLRLALRYDNGRIF